MRKGKGEALRSSLVLDMAIAGDANCYLFVVFCLIHVPDLGVAPQSSSEENVRP